MKPEQKIQLTQIANNILNSDTVLAPEFKTPLTSAIENLEKFVEKINNIAATETEISDEVKDKLYLEYKDMMQVLYNNFKNTKYNFTLSKDEYKFFHKQICRKLKYDRQDNILALRVRDNFFKVAESKKVYENNALTETFQLPIEDITIISHLNSKIVLEGITEENVHFSTITEKIGAISRIYEYVDMKGEDTSNEILNWFAGLEQEAVQSEENIEVQNQ
jgi:hypothetical protein